MSATKNSAICLAWLALACYGAPAWAALGGDRASVEADQAALSATLATHAEQGYTDYALSLPSGVVVHEFVNGNGQVFEVTWNGKGVRPDMRQILGGYFDRLQGSNANASASRSPLARRADHVSADVEFHSVVRNRWFSGTAHLPAQLPSSLSQALAVPKEDVRKP